MKSRTSIFLGISFLLALSITAWAYYQTTHKVGELTADKRIDKDFKVCNEDQITEYYGMDTDYQGGKKAIKDRILKDLESLNFKGSGLITFRFIVNCKGEIGRFRVKATNLDLQKREVGTENIDEIEKALAGLKNWNPAKNNHGSYDSYYLLNFKIKDRKIADIF